MKRRPGALARQRERIAAALRADPTRGNRDIGREIDCSEHTVARVRNALRNENGAAVTHPGASNLMPPAEPGNLRALKHGVDSEVRLEPLRIAGEKWARERWTWLDDARVALLADLSARVELARRWIEEQGTVVKNKGGDVFPVVDRLDSWSKRLDDLIVRLDAEQEKREAASVEDLGAYVERTYGG